MIIEEIQGCLQGSIHSFDCTGAKGQAAELERFRAALDPFGKMTIKDFGDVLKQLQSANLLAKSLPGAKPRPKADVDKDLVQKTLREIEQLFDRANNASALDHELITAEVKRWDKALNKEEGLEVSKLFLNTEFAADISKRAALEAVGRKISDRLSAQKRIENLARPYEHSDQTGGAIAS